MCIPNAKRAGLCALFLSLASLVFADLVVEQAVTSDMMPDQPLRGSRMIITVKGQKARVDLPENKMSSIVDVQGNKMYTIDHGQKRVMVMSLDMLKQAADISKQNNGTSKAKITETGRKDVILGHDCKQYRILGAGNNPAAISCWIAEDIDDSEMKVFRNFGGKLGGFFGMSDVEKPQGMVMRTETKMRIGDRAVSSRSEVKNIKRDPVSDSVFVLPSDYKVVEMPKLGSGLASPAAGQSKTRGK